MHPCIEGSEELDSYFCVDTSRKERELQGMYLQVGLHLYNPGSCEADDKRMTLQCHWDTHTLGITGLSLSRKADNLRNNRSEPSPHVIPDRKKATTDAVSDVQHSFLMK